MKKYGYQSFSLKYEFALLHNIPMELAVYDLGGDYVFVNDEYCPDPSLSRNVIGQNDVYFFQRAGFNEEALKKREQNFQKVLQYRKPVRFTETLESVNSKKVQSYKRFYQPLFSTGDKTNIKYIAFYGSNITAIIHAQRELKYLAYHDKLTNLQNRDAFYDQLERIIVEWDRDDKDRFTAILYCDLDNFKMVNDSYGHNVGDAVLLEVANRLIRSVRKSDYVYRIGGDEYTIILRNLNHEYEAGKVTQKILRNISAEYNIDGRKISYITASIGIVIFPRDGLEREVLVKKADTAMYDSKKNGKNKFQFFTTAMTKESVKRLELENQLMTMVRNNDFDSQLKMLYQPIIEKRLTGDYKIIGTEALLRWENPKLGPIMPDVFIPVAEENDLIEEIGDWVIYQTCKDFKTLSDRINYQLYVSINFSPKQLRSDRMISNLKRNITELDYDPSYLQLEMTETSYLDDEQAVIHNMEKLKELGVRLAIDDFGIGFASLVYLQKVPAETIKIDKSFIQYVNSSEKYKELVKSIILMGKNLNKDVIAEGVEAIEHLDFLDAQQCTKYQGFIFSKPLELIEFEALLKKEKQIHLIVSP
jgi:diguanylate cyclase (GGDEF)-like protein